MESLAEVLKGVEIVDVTDVAMDYERQAQAEVIVLYRQLVDDLRAIIESCPDAYLHIPVSQGKDSTLVELAALQAYRESIAAGKIEARRPLVLSTVSTLLESLPMEMYVHFVKGAVQRYAEEVGINLYYDIVTPPLNDQLLIKWASSNKLIPNPSRHADCSVVWKVDTSRRYLRRINARFSASSDMARYADAQVITCVGSRQDEGSRRSTSMARQGIRDKRAEHLLAEMEEIGSGSRVKKFAPISDWSTDQVFLALSLAGTDPLTRAVVPHQGPVIESFFPHMALLIELYGNGNDGPCEVAIGKAAGGAGCNGRARYGCWSCTMVAQTDKSSTALLRYPRWTALGAEKALRVRDWMYRLSTDMNARAFHARAHDPACYNRLVLQPNVLKTRYLEKLVAYGAQLTLESAEAAAEFKTLLDAGREAEHPGYADILNDPTLSGKARAQMLEMYRSQAVRPLISCFSEKMAVLLSFRWSIDGIATAPYRPLAIWRNAVAGKRLKYPELNSEWTERHGPISMTNDLPDAVMLPFFQYECPKNWAGSPSELLSWWQRPVDTADFFEEDFNCTLQTEAKSSMKLSWLADYQMSVVDGDQAPVQGQELFTRQLDGAPVTFVLESSSVSGAALGGKRLGPRAVERLAGELEQQTRKHWVDVIDQVVDAALEQGFARGMSSEAIRDEVQQTVIRAFSKQNRLHRQVRFFHGEELSLTVRQEGKTAAPALDFTRRVTKVRKGKLEKGNTRLVFYPVQVQPRLERAHMVTAEQLTLDFDAHAAKRISVQTNPLQYSAELSDVESIDISDTALAEWKAYGGMERALQEHDDHLTTRIRKRHLRGYTRVRAYTGSHVAHHLMTVAGVTIQERYVGQLKDIIKRTELFDEIGAFDFQLLTNKQILSYPQAITMAQHRQDKAQVLLEIRKLRNDRRRIVKSLLAELDEGRQASLLGKAAFDWAGAMYDQAGKAVDHVVADGLAASFGAAFRDDKVSLQERAAHARLWLAVRADELVSPADAITAAVGRKYLADQGVTPQEMLFATRMVANQGEAFLTKAVASVAMWRPLVAATAEFSGQYQAAMACEAFDIDQWRGRWVAMLNELHPGQERHIAFMPEVRMNAEAWAERLQGIVETAERSLALVQELVEEVRQGHAASARKIVTKMSLADRIKMMKGVA